MTLRDRLRRRLLLLQVRLLRHQREEALLAYYYGNTPYAALPHPKRVAAIDQQIEDRMVELEGLR